MNNSFDNDFDESLALSLDPLVDSFLSQNDYAAASRRAVRSDIYKFGKWFVRANREPFDPTRTTTRDIADFRDALRRERNQAISTVNRNLVSIRRFFSWLKEKGRIEAS